MSTHEKKHSEGASADKGGRKEYRPPELVEWGSILDLTQGPKSGFEDFPAIGGTKGV